jgi:hypothetical protein
MFVYQLSIRGNHNDNSGLLITYVNNFLTPIYLKTILKMSLNVCTYRTMVCLIGRNTLTCMYIIKVTQFLNVSAITCIDTLQRL